MLELYMWGIDNKGNEFPKRHMMGRCINSLINEYLKSFPTVVRIHMDVAINTTHLVVE